MTIPPTEVNKTPTVSNWGVCTALLAWQQIIARMEVLSSRPYLWAYCACAPSLESHASGYAIRRMWVRAGSHLVSSEAASGAQARNRTAVSIVQRFINLMLAKERSSGHKVFRSQRITAHQGEGNPHSTHYQGLGGQQREGSFRCWIGEKSGLERGKGRRTPRAPESK